MAKLKVLRCVVGLLFILYLKVLLSNVGTINIGIVSSFALPDYLRFVSPVILSILILLTMFYWSRYRHRSTIAMFLTVEFFVVLFSYALLPTDNFCEMTITDWPNCIFARNFAAQLVVFASIISQISHSRVVKACTSLLLFVAIIVLLIYEKTTDIILSVLFTVLIFTNPFIIKISKFFILESPYFERIHDVSISKHVITSI
jgi:hypothetical protein